MEQNINNIVILFLRKVKLEMKMYMNKAKLNLLKFRKKNWIVLKKRI